ncbi:hypothetical protein BU16DRAFT_499317 [Lophium mytilinum]|uniref:Clustered mitochondria protein homolog n=1 Tax=Lophium mytilinum TaxID=390894 RepID=A0A6A6RF63_9PEZI|nr:hypothetical protein BU16DRAFT_499317 [Lophium mytilinum]
MADHHDASITGLSQPTDAVSTVNGDATGESSQDEPNGDNAETVFQITVILPHEPYKTQVMMSTQEQVQDLRQSIVEQPPTFQYSCFHLEHKGQRINDFIELSEVPSLSPDSELTLVEDPYTEKDARMHVVRVRELIGAAGDRTDTLHGVLAGLSLHDSVGPDTVENSVANGASPAAPEGAVMGDYDFEALGSVKHLLPPAPESPLKTLKSIAVSPWNPPPYHLRAKGHLLYLQVTTIEGEQHQITAHVGGFYVNKSSNSKFDPFPRPPPKDYAAHSLLNLIAQISPSFDPAFKALLDLNAKKDLLTIFQLSNAIPANPWMVPPPSSSLTTHQSDIARTQESYLISGLENTDTLRDWNEEFQSTREMAKEAVQDRVFRERLTSKLFADYNDAATRGAMLVARGEVAPLNPTESRDAQIFVYNNIFFSFGADGVGTFTTDGGDEAARVATGKDVTGVRAVNNLDIQGLFTPGTVVVDYLGKRIVGQSIVPGIFKQREPGEHQIDYGGVEGKDVVAEDAAFVPLFEKLSKLLHVKKHPVWDKEDIRHELEGSVETKGLIGTDGRKYALDLYRVTPLDVSWIEQYWSEPPKDDSAKPKESDYPHRMAVLRPELVESFSRVRLRDYIKEELAKKAESTKESAGSTKTSESNGEKADEGAVAKKDAESQEDGGDKEAEQERVDISGFRFALNPDVFCGQKPQSDEDKEEWAKDEAEVRAACGHLLSEVIPRLVHELQEGEVGFPMDGASLSTLLHKRGINIRYLGKLATLADKEDARLQALKRLSVQEMISRGFKHVANQFMRHLPVPFAVSCMAHLLNCLLGEGVNGKPVPQLDDSLKAMYPEGDFSFEKVSPATLKKDITAQVALRYRFDLGDNWIEHDRYLQLLREVSLKLGLQLEGKEYVFVKEPHTNGASHTDGNAVVPTNGNTNGSSKKKKKQASPPRPASPAVPAPSLTFHADDILNIVPVVKEASPKSMLAEEALDAGRLSMAQDQKELGQELLLESLSLHEQIYGVLHPEVARAYHQLSNLLYTLEEKNAAVELAHKAVIVSERTLGVDHAETVLCYLNLGLFEHATGNTKAALHYVRHALELWKIIYGPNHPDSITTINNAAVMLQSMKQYHESRLWFEASLAICEQVSGKQSINTATLLFQLSQALALDKDMRGAANRMRESYKIFNAVLGSEDRNTKEAGQWLEQFTQTAVTQAKQLQDLAKGKVRRVQLNTRGTLRPQPQVGQTSAQADGREARSISSQFRDQRSVEELLKYIEGGDSPKKSTPKKRTANPKRRAQKADDL